MSSLEELQLLAQLEEKMADLYGRFSALFSHDVAAASLFSRLSLDEMAHRDIIRSERRLVVENAVETDDVIVDIHVIEGALARVEEIHRSAGTLSLDDALHITLELESHTCEFYYRHAIDQSSPDVARLLSSLGGTCCQHSDDIEAFAKSRGAMPENLM